MSSKTKSYTVIGIVIVLIVLIVLFFWIMAGTTDAGSSFSLKQYLTGLELAALDKEATSTSNTAATTTATTHAVTSGFPQASPAVHPFMYALSPESGTSGLTIIITGYGFDSAVNDITFGPYDGRHSVNGLADNIIATEGSNDGKTLTFNVPFDAPNGLLCDATGKNCTAVAPAVLTPGTYPVTVTSRGGTSNTIYFTLTH